MSSKQRLGQETRQHGEHERKKAERDIKSYRRTVIRKSAKAGVRAAVRGDIERLAVICRDRLMPALGITEWDVDGYHSALEASLLAWDWDAVLRFVDDPGRWVAAASGETDMSHAAMRRRQKRRVSGDLPAEDVVERTVSRAFKSLESIAVAQGVLPGKLSQSSQVMGHATQVGLQWQSFDYSTPDEVQVVNPDIHPSFTMALGQPGNGKSTAVDTLANDAYAAGHKVIDLVDMDELENGMHDVPPQDEELVEARERLGLHGSFEDHPDLEAPDVEILHPLTQEMVNSDLPYDTERECFTARPFVIPAPSLDHSTLKSMLPHITDTQGNYLSEALESLSDLEDWDLTDLNDAILRTEANEGVKRRLHSAVTTLQNRGFIGRYDHEYAIDWPEIFEDTDTVTVFSCSLMEQEVHKLMVVSYLVDAIYEERYPDNPSLGDDGEVDEVTDYPRAYMIAREMQAVAPGQGKLKGNDDSRAKIQGKILSQMQKLGEKRRHVDLGIIGDTQQWMQVNARVRANVDRVLLFGNQAATVTDVMEQITGREYQQQSEKISGYEVGDCAVVGPQWISTNQSFVAPVSWAPPLCHHLDTETEPDGWHSRIEYLDREELRSSPYTMDGAELDSPDDVEESPEEKTPNGFGEFVDWALEPVQNESQKVPKAVVRELYNDYAEDHDELPVGPAEATLGGWVRAFFDEDEHPGKQMPKYDSWDQKVNAYGRLKLTDEAAARREELTVWEDEDD